MNKKLLGMVAAVSVMFYASSVKAMAIPSHSIVIGNKAYSIDYIVKPANYGEINSAIMDASNIYYVVNSSTVKDLFFNTYVSTDLIDSIPTITYKDGDGEVYTAASGSSTLQPVANPFMSTAKVEIGSSFNLIKKITVTNTTVPDAKYFTVDGGYIRPIGTPIQTTISGSSVNVYFYSDSAGTNLVATGKLDVSSPSGAVDRPVSNLSYAMGNSSGNINNMGLVAGDANNQWIYYRGTAGDLYKVKTDGVDRTQLTTGHDAKYINVVGNEVYYVHTTAATKTVPASTSVYRMNVDGSDAQPIVSGGKQVGTMGNLVFASANQLDDVIVAGDWIYYINHTDGSLNRVNVNGYGNVTISTDKYTDINIVKNNIYGINLSQGGKIYKIDVNGFAASKVSDVQARHLNVTDNWIYYRNYSDNEKLYRMSTDGIENDKLCDDMVYNLNVCGDTVYYKNGSDGNKLYKIGADGTGGQQVLTPVAKTLGTKLSNDVVEYINVVDPTVYYTPLSMTPLNSIVKDGSNKTTLK